MTSGGKRGSAPQPRSRTSASAPGSAKRPTHPRRQRGAGFWTLLVGGLVAVALVVGVAYGSLAGGGIGSSAGWVEQGNGGSWTNVDPNRLADMMTKKDFTLLNVKTPYIGEITGTDLYIPYTQLTARASELPADRNAKIVVYCRAGNESRVALQTLIDMGYTNLWNLDKGMESWAATGRQIIQKPRS